MPHDQPVPPVDVVDAGCPPDAPITPDVVGAPEPAGSVEPVGMPAGDAEPAPAAEPSAGPESPLPDIDAGGDLEELVLPSLVRALEPLPPGTEIGPQGRLRVTEHRGTRGRVNLYAATWRQDDGQEIEVELRE